ncbi:MAG TPA: SDR family oxidoreductase [Bryobacteraceae bacterium]|nr:SDR family oxidoreductase [Bryobacteraceae bacterium]
MLARALPSYGPYIASKAGVEGLVHVLANELRGRNTTVDAIAPGPVGTELFLTGKSPELVAQLAKMAALERLGEPDDIRQRGSVSGRTGRRLGQFAGAARERRIRLRPALG